MKCWSEQKRGKTLIAELIGAVLIGCGERGQDKSESFASYQNGTHNNSLKIHYQQNTNIYNMTETTSSLKVEPTYDLRLVIQLVGKTKKVANIHNVSID